MDRVRMSSDLCADMLVLIVAPSSVSKLRSGDRDLRDGTDVSSRL